MQSVKKILVVQRISLSHEKLMSRSIAARFSPLLDYMEQHQMIVWKAIPEDEITIRQLESFDVVLFNKHTSVRALDLLRLSNDLGKLSIYDLDDWILDLPQYSVTSLDDDIIKNIGCMLREATRVSVSNELLKKKLKPLRADVMVVPNGFDHNAIPSLPQTWNESVPARILFSNTDGLKLIKFRKPFVEMLRRFLTLNNVILDFWGDPFPEMHAIDNINPMGFQSNTVYKIAIRNAGYLFAVVPLGGAEDVDTLFFNSCKSCIKYIDYGSLGIPAIYSDTPVYSSVVKHRSNGLLAANDATSWINALDELYQNNDLRRQIRQTAYLDTKANFGLDVAARAFSELLN
jgi:glycosyltransferase involved in cell wall biosynthesis